MRTVRWKVATTVVVLKKRKDSRSTCIHFSSGEVEEVKAIVLPAHPTLHLKRSRNVLGRKQRLRLKSTGGFRVIRDGECVYILRSLASHLVMQLHTSIYQRRLYVVIARMSVRALRSQMRWLWSMSLARHPPIGRNSKTLADKGCWKSDVVVPSIRFGNWPRTSRYPFQGSL